MSSEPQLQAKLRRSDVLTEEDIYKDFMAYAQEVSDQLDIYQYMEDNLIGINQTEFWLQRFQAMRKRCDLVELVKMIDKVKFYEEIEQNCILQYERKLSQDFYQIIQGSQGKGKRKVNAYYLLKQKKIFPQTRKIGGIEVYVDSPQRKNYELQDCAKYIEKEMKEFCQIERQEFQRIHRRKPPSFLAKKEQHLLKLAEQLLSKNPRKSLNPRNSLATLRPSNERKWKFLENSLEAKNYQTPKNSEQINPQKQRLKSKIEHDRSRDSVEILRQMHQKQQFSQIYRSPTFKGGYQEERCRGKPQQQDQSPFSFGKERIFKLKNRSFERVRDPQDSQLNSDMNNAFIAYSFSKDQVANKKAQPQNRAEEQLTKLIQQCQQQKYNKKKQTTTFSQIDSNQQNINYLQTSSSFPQFVDSSRKPFQVLFQTDSHHLVELSSIKKKQQMQKNNDLNTQSLEIVVKELQLYSEQKQSTKMTESPVFYSQRKVRKASKEEKKKIFGKIEG